MIRPIDFKFTFAIVVSLFWILNPASPVDAHSGHKHDDEPSISLPRVLAKVNGTDILKDDIWLDLKKSLKRIKGRGLPVTSDQEKRAAKQILDKVINRNLLLQKADAMGLSVPSSRVEKKLNSIKSKFSSEKVFLQKLKQRKLTLDSYRTQLQQDLLVGDVLKKEIAPQVQVTDEQLKTYYQNNKKKFLREEQRRASVILIKINPNRPSQREEKARKILDKVQKKLSEGREFADVAREFSRDSLAKRGGDLGYLTQNHMYKPFADRAFKMKVGEVSDVFRSPHGLHLLMLSDIKEGSKGTFEAEKENVREAYIQQEIIKRKKPYLKALRKQAKMKVYF